MQRQQQKREKWKKRGLSYFQSASHVSSSLQSDLASLCNNIQREDNCWVHAHGPALIFKTGHGAAEKRPVSLMAVCRRITYSETDLENGVVTSGVNAGGTTTSWLEHPDGEAATWLHAPCSGAISWCHQIIALAKWQTTEVNSNRWEMNS